MIAALISFLGFMAHDWLGGYALGMVVMAAIVSTVIRDRGRKEYDLRAELGRANSAILALRKDGWATLEEDAARLAAIRAAPRRALPARGKGGRFLSKDDALRARGVPVDFARAVGQARAAFEIVRSGKGLGADEMRDRILADAIDGHFSTRHGF